MCRQKTICLKPFVDSLLQKVIIIRRTECKIFIFQARLAAASHNWFFKNKEKKKKKQNETLQKPAYLALCLQLACHVFALHVTCRHFLNSAASHRSEGCTWPTDDRNITVGKRW